MERSPQFSRSQQFTGDDGYNRMNSSNSLQGPWPVSPTALPSSPTAFPVPLGSTSSAPMFDRLDVQQPMFPDAQRDDYIESSNASTSNASIPNPRHYQHTPNSLAQDRGIPNRSNFGNENNTEYLRNLGGDEAGVRKPEYAKRITNSSEPPRRDLGHFDAQTQEDWQRYSSSPKDAGAPPSYDFRGPHNHAAEQEYARDYSRFHSGSPRQAPHRAQEEPHSPYGSKNSRPPSTSGNVPPIVDYSDYYNDESVSYRDSRRNSSPPRHRTRQQTRPPYSDSRDEESWKAYSRDSSEGHDDFRAKPPDPSRRGRRKEQRLHSKTYDDDRSGSPDSPRVERGRSSRPRRHEDWRHDSDDESSFDSSRSDRWRDRSSGRRQSKSKDRYVRTRSKSRERNVANGRRSRSNSAKGGQRNSFEKVKEKHQERVSRRQNKAESYRKVARGYQDDIDLTSYSSLGTYEGTSRRPASRYLDDDDESSSSASIYENPTRRSGRHDKIYEKEQESSSESSESSTPRKISRDKGRPISKKKQNLVESIPKQQKPRNRSKSRERSKKPQQNQYEVSFSPSTDVPKENFEVLEEAPSSCSSIERYAQRMADANLMKEQSEARHQILSEIRQANAMRMTATSDFDKRFWDKQIRTLNESLKNLFIQQGMVLNAESLLQNFEEMALEDSSAAESVGSGTTGRSVPVAPSPVSSATTIKVRAPEDLPEGHRFTVRVDGKPLTLKVPEGGVSKGDFFSIQLAQDEKKHHGTPTPSTAVVHKSPIPNSSLQEDDRQTSSFSNHKTSNTIQVRAPTDLPEGYKFKATRDGQQILATVPKGGTRKGEVFVATVEKEHQL